MGEPAAVYNAIGIKFLLEGNHFHALDMFKEAARLIQTEGRISRRNAVSCCTSTYACNPTPLIAKQECDHGMEDSSSTFHTSSTRPYPMFARTTLDGESCFIFCDPIDIEYTEKLRTCARDSAIVLYNMALTYHLLNVPTHQKERTRRHALLLYELSYNIALQDLDDETSTRIISVTLNNMAQIELELGNFKEAQGCLDDLKEYLMSLKEPSSLKIKIERNQLFLNATLLGNPKGAPAA
jgi:tetratricopeptide (TPR) repeat protein